MYYNNSYGNVSNGLNMGNSFDMYSNFNDFGGLSNFDSYSGFRNMGNVPSLSNYMNTGGFGSGNVSQGLGKVGLFTRIAKGVNWNNLLNNTQKTLNIVNQAIPIVNQAKPLVNNMRTMLRIANIMKEDNGNNTNLNSSKNVKVTRNNNVENISDYKENSQPTFFL